VPIDFAALRGEDDAATAGVPTDGDHAARLERAVLHDGDRGTQLITEWSDERNLMWTSWNRFDGQGLKYTQELLDGLGVDRQSVMDDAQLAQELAAVEGRHYRVRTQSKQGRNGDRWFTNTYVDGPAVPVEPDVPVDTRGLPAESPAVTTADYAAQDLFGDEDIPF